jgi:hypothetical protein
MAKGTGGTIYLIGLIFAIIVAFVLLGIAYYMNTKWTEATQEIVDAKRKLAEKADEVATLTAQVQQQNKLINGGGQAANYSQYMSQYMDNYNTKLQDMLNEEYIALGPELELIKSQEVKDTWKKLQGFKDQFPRYTNLVDYQIDVLQQLQACIHIIPGLYIKLIRSEEEKEQIRKQIEDNRKAMQEQIDTLTAQKNRTEDEKIEAGRKFENERRQHQDDKDAKDKEITAIKREYDIKLVKKEREIDTLTARVKELSKRSQRMFVDVAQPDGEVSFADAKLGYAWIDLGKGNGIQKGMRFQAYQNAKGGRHRIKAMLEVKKVEQDSSQVAILQDYEYYDPDAKEKHILPYENDPVVKGDLIRSVWFPDGRPSYEKGEVPRFFFLGKNVGNRFYTKNELAKKIEEFGGKVLPELTAEVKYVVILPKGEDEDPKGYEKAILFGTTFIKEDELLDFIGK